MISEIDLRDVFYDTYRESVRNGNSYWTAHGAGLLAVATASQTASRAVVERLQGELDAFKATEEFRVSYSYGVNSGRQTGRSPEAIVNDIIRWSMGAINVDLVEKRIIASKVSPWLPVPTDGAEKTFAWAEKYAPDWVARAKRKAEAAEN